MKTVKTFFLFMWGCAGIVINASGYEIEKISIENGLSNNNVISFTQDRDGFIWIATKDGLNRFDGNSFKIFKKKDSDNNSISSNVLNCVYADKFDDLVWIATEKNGIDAYNYRTHEFTHYAHDYSNTKNSLIADGVTHITSDSKGNLWLATYQAGIDYFDKQTGQFIHYNKSNIKGLGSDYNWYVMQETDEIIYAGHVSDGFSIININTKTAVNFKHDPNNPASLANNTVTCIFKDSHENIWIGTRNGLTLFNAQNYQMINFKNDPDNPASLSHNFIKSIIETKDHMLWIGLEGGGVNIVDLSKISGNISPRTVSFERIKVSDTPDGLSSGSVQNIIQDSFGNKWIGGLGGGINFIANNESFFRKISYLPLKGNTNSLYNKSVPGLCVDSDNLVWAANYSGGISIYSKGVKIKHIISINNDPVTPVITCVYKDRENIIWVGTDDGRIYYYRKDSDRFIRLTCFDDLKNVPLYNFFEDSKHNLWISTDVGVFVYNIKTHQCKKYTTENSELSDNVIRTIAEDSYGNIWIGTLIGGLCVFDQNFRLINNYGWSYDFYSVNYIYMDSRKRIWVCSQNDLFLFKNYRNDSVLRIGKSSGLAETDIRAITEGKSADVIWLSTINGISHIDLNTMHISNFNVSDNISYGDYINGSITKTDDGKIFFGSQNGITWFDQVLKQSFNLIPETVITSFRVADTKINNLNEFKDVPFADSLELRYHQNSFQLHFNVLDYSLSDKVEFVFQMKGLDDAWYLINQDKYVTFRNLSPGNYTFNLKTRLHNTEWPENITSMHITIHAPAWSALWARIIYVFLILLVIYYIIKFYKYQLKIENSLVLEKKSRQQEHELNEEKIKFFTNITHELRTPMTLILGPLEDLISDTTLNPEQSKKIISIHRIANRLLHLINQILEFRKSTNKSRKLRVLKDDFVKFVNDTSLKYNELNHKKNIEFKVTVPDEKIDMFYDPEVVTIILDNLLSNAFKYTHKGTIDLKLDYFEENKISYTEITVADSGFGISEQDLPHIFERYYQAKNASHPVSGTGIGLALVKNMVELHEAEISVTSQMNEGSVFRVRFITYNSYPDVIHIHPGGPLAVEEDEADGKDVILVVDDNQDIIDYIHDCLSDTYSIISTVNGKKGFDIACLKIPDLVISDIMMPIMDGIEMCKKMKQDVRTSHIPVVLLTAKGSLQDQSEGYDAGADSYLTKPFSANLLKSRLRNILEARKKISAAYSSKFKEKQSSFHNSINQLDKEFIEKLTEIIEKNLEDEEMNISQIASHLNMSHSTLYRKIKALTGLTANEYIRKTRLRFAEQLLLANQYTISEIMYRIGINSSSYFRQCFKEEYGMNPSEYLQKLKEE